jgi:cell division transport system permease protein
MRAFQYACEEAAASLWRGRHAGLLSTGTIALALFVLGGFLLVTANLERLGEEWSSAAELSVYLKDDITDTERALVEAELTPGDLVTGREYVSKAEALVRFRQTFGDLGSTIDALGENPLPSSYEVRLRPGPDAATGAESLGATLRQMAGVADVRYDREWLDRLLSAIVVIRDVGWVLGSVLTIAAALTVANVVRLALHARRDEIEIMQLVGAPQAYLRGPFVMEGVLQGGIGALAALGVLWIAYAGLRAQYLVPLAEAINLSAVGFLPLGLSAALVAGGMAVGCAGGLVATWRRR